jgi:hypothetical protein
LATAIAIGRKTFDKLLTIESGLVDGIQSNER